MSGRGTSVEDPFRAQVAAAIGFLGGMDLRNLRMLPNVLSILARVSAANGYYDRDLVARERPRDDRRRTVTRHARVRRDTKRRPPEPLGPPPIAAAVS